MLAIGLTGGIASGKTSVSDIFASLGTPIIDSDIVSRELMQQGESAFNKVVHHFGESILTADENIDRSQLRQIIFNDDNEKNWLESILHPLIYQRCSDLIEMHTDESYLLLVVPLLFEANFESLVDRVCVVNCPAELQIQRLCKRDNIDEKLAKLMLSRQWSNQQRILKAEDIIYNDRDGIDLRPQINALHQTYLALSPV
jgi:dephospho-CoA kinase